MNPITAIFVLAALVALGYVVGAPAPVILAGSLILAVVNSFVAYAKALKRTAEREQFEDLMQQAIEQGVGGVSSSGPLGFTPPAA